MNTCPTDLSDMDIMDMTPAEREAFLSDLSATELREIIGHASAMVNYQRSRLAIYAARERCEKERVAAIQKEWAQ